MSKIKVSELAASTRDVDFGPPAANQDCADVVHISVFFDGTGNNINKDNAGKSWSNPARMWMASEEFARKEKIQSAYPIYIAGVGTPFNGSAISAFDEAAISVEDSGLFGGAAGAGGDRRIRFARQRVNSALSAALLDRAKELEKAVAKHSRAGVKRSFSDVERFLDRHRLIKQVNVSIFGFSRGAALARAFCNEWLWACKEDRGVLTYEGHRIRFIFMGLFDTVASFGLPAGNAQNTFAHGGFRGRDLVVDDRVERCVHFVAAHELRFSFPVDVIRKDGVLAGNWSEVVYPGVHSDVGGGYGVFDQGVVNNYSRIPLRDMIREALMCGVRIYPYENFAADPGYRQFFQDRFEVRKETEEAYLSYKAACDPKGSVEDCVKSHMEQLYSAYGTLYRNGVESVTQRQHREGNSWVWGPKDMATELANYKAALMAIKGQSISTNPVVSSVTSPCYIIAFGAYAMWIAPEDWQLKAWQRTAPKGVTTFVDRFIHDSKVGFLHNAEPFSYFSTRGIDESSRSVAGWVEFNIARPVDAAIESTVDFAAEKAEQAQKVAQETARTAKIKAEQMARAAQAKAEAVAQVSKAKATEVARATQVKAEQLAKAGEEKIRATADLAQRKADEVSKAVASTAKSVSDAAKRATMKSLEFVVDAFEAYEY